MDRESMKRIVALVILAFGLTACSSQSRHTAARLDSASPTSVTSTTIDPTVVPAVITIDYLNAVLAQLNAVQGDAVRTMVNTDQIPSAVTDRLRAIYNDPLFSRQLRVVSEEMVAGFSNVKKPPGDRTMLVKRVMSVSATCLWIETHTDFSAVTITPRDTAASEYLGLRIKQAGIDPSRINPTPWAFDFSATFPAPTPPPPDPCAGH
jgi:hypothetical protein